MSATLAQDDDVRPPVLGLALGGGGALGWAHIGALRALEENGLKPDVIAGTSIGALVGACVITDALDTLEETARAMSWRRMLAYADPQIGKPGILKGAAIIADLERHLGSCLIEELGRPFAAVASDLMSGTEVRLVTGPLEEAVRASISIPGVFLPVERDGQLLVDGGLVNPVPVSAARALGAEVVVAIDITGDYRGRARAAGIAMPGTSVAPVAPRRKGVAGLAQGASRRLLRRSAARPGLYSVAMTSVALMMRELALAKLALDPPDVHVVPPVGHISPIEFDRAVDLIEAGRTAMQAALPALKQAMKRCELKSSD